MRPGLALLFSVCLRIGLLSFGGPAAQIALMHQEFVDRRRWLGEQQYLNALSFCMLLPGPEAMQLATYVGWRLHGVIGGLIAGLLFVLPGACVILLLAAVYAWYGDVPLVAALFLGIKAAVIIIVIEALLKVARRALGSAVHWVIAGLAFVAIFLLAVPFPLIVVAAAALGFVLAGTEAIGESVAAPRISLAGTLATTLTWLVVWWLPLGLLAAMGGHDLLVEIGLFFSKLAVVTFGGAYAVLAYLGQAAVGEFGWLSAGEMMDGLGLAETTPGPLILVTEFVGYLAGYRAGGFEYGLLAALVTLWMTFAPCFLWIFVGAPYIEWICAQRRLRGALNAITAAVVGVILNLSIWFALQVFFGDLERANVGPVGWWQPALASLDWRALVLALLCALLLLRLHWGITRVLVLAALGGALLSLV
ncbi:MAG: chromate efflux transporter [Gammaproteobacteria bacterium]|nr:chromate efflux transporter [Gammaproteobacteria bacterium]